MEDQAHGEVIINITLISVKNIKIWVFTLKQMLIISNINNWCFIIDKRRSIPRLIQDLSPIMKK